LKRSEAAPFGKGVVVLLSVLYCGSSLDLDIIVLIILSFCLILGRASIVYPANPLPPRQTPHPIRTHASHPPVHITITPLHTFKPPIYLTQQPSVSHIPRPFLPHHPGSSNIHPNAFSLGGFSSYQGIGPLISRPRDEFKIKNVGLSLLNCSGGVDRKVSSFFLLWD
jgi:hypothetical protein